MAITRSKRPVAAARMAAAAGRLLDASALCAIATASPNGRAHINTAYFAWSPDFNVVWLSEPRARHSKNLEANRSAAIAVFDSNQTWGKPDRGVQLFGSARAATRRTADGARAAYGRRFPDYDAEELSAYLPYEFRARRVKLFDEPELGAGVFVTARVDGGEIAWERTEVYSAAE
jgi:uncharacterized protein YhbP (UPF0306 family)